MELGTVKLLTSLLFFFPIISALVILLIKTPWKEAPGYTAFLSMLMTFFLIISLIPFLWREQIFIITFPWLKRLNIYFDLRFDSFCLLLLLTTTGLASLIILFSLGYFKEGLRNPHVFYSLALLFIWSLIGLILVTDIFQFWLFFEFMLVSSYFLVAYQVKNVEEHPKNTLTPQSSRERTKPSLPGAEAREFLRAWEKIRPSLLYFIFTQLGAAVLFFALLWTYRINKFTTIYDITPYFHTLAHFHPLAHPLNVLAPLFLIGFGIELAIVPFHLWLPLTLSGTSWPVSIMVCVILINASAYGLLRLAYSFFSIVTIVSLFRLIVFFSLISIFYGGIRALLEKDLCRFVAYSTTSQMGFILLGVGVAIEEGASGSIFNIASGSIIRACLFLSLGCVFYSTGTCRINELGGLIRRMPLTATCCIISALGLIGMPPFCGYKGLSLIISGAYYSGHLFSMFLAILGLLLTVLYTIKLVLKIFFGKTPDNLSILKEPPAYLLVPMAILSAAILFFGIYTAPLSNLVNHSYSILTQVLR